MAIFETILELLRRKENFVLATILGQCGSTPREAGSRMLVLSDGSIRGTVGGGILEATVRELARDVFKSRKTLLKEFALTDQSRDEGALGMICGGTAQFLIHFEDAARPGRLEHYESLRAARNSGKSAWLAVKLPEREVSEEIPRGYLIREGRAPEGAELPPVKELLLDASATHPSVVDYEGEKFFVEPLCSQGTVYIFGAGHIGGKLAHLTSFVGFRTVVLDDRQEFANSGLLPSADRVVVLSHFDEAVKGLDINGDSYLVIVTRGHAHDKTVLAQALGTGAGYIGMIGSRKKRDATYRALAKEGFSERDLGRVHSPIGLNIGGQTPEEIAVSIVAELIQVRAGRAR